MIEIAAAIPPKLIASSRKPQVNSIELTRTDQFRDIFDPLDSLINLLPAHYPHDHQEELFDNLYRRIESKRTQLRLGECLQDKKQRALLIDRLVRLNSIADNRQNPIIHEFIRVFVEKNSETLEQFLDRKNPPSLTVQTLQLFTSIIVPNPYVVSGVSDPRYRRYIDLGLSVFLRHFSTVKSALENRLEGYDFVPTLQKILYDGQTEILEPTFKVLRKQIKEGHGLDLFDRLFAQDTDYVYYKPAKPLLRSHLARYGIDPDLLFSTWEVCTSEIFLSDIIRQSLTTIAALEKAHPGSTQYFIARHSLRNFGRYPPEILIRLYEDYQKVEAGQTPEKKPYTILIATTNYDKNGIMYKSNREFQDLAQQLEEKFPGQFRLVVIEYDNRQQAIHEINRFRKTFGKASFGIIELHGLPYNVTTGEQDQVTLDDLQRPGTDALRLAFTEDATVILYSCLTGVETVDPKIFAPFDNDSREKAIKYLGQPGFAATASAKIGGLYFIAPTTLTRGVKFNVEKIGNKPQIGIVFAEGQEATATYHQGARIA